MWFTSAAMLAVGNSSELPANGTGRDPFLDFRGGGASERIAARTSGRVSRRGSPDQVRAVGTAEPPDSSSQQVTAYRQAAQRLAGGGAAAPGSDRTSAEAQQVIAQLKSTDLAVRSHEAAHVAAGGSLVRGAASFTLVNGPDGRMYATGGEVSIDTAPVPGNPQATIQKMVTVRAAALAPSDPSAADRAVAAAAVQVAAQARAELARASAQEVGAAYSPVRPEPVPAFAATA